MRARPASVSVSSERPPSVWSACRQTTPVSTVPATGLLGRGCAILPPPRAPRQPGDVLAPARRDCRFPMDAVVSADADETPAADELGTPAARSSGRSLRQGDANAGRQQSGRSVVVPSERAVSVSRDARLSHPANVRRRAQRRALRPYRASWCPEHEPLLRRSLGEPLLRCDCDCDCDCDCVATQGTYLLPSLPEVAVDGHRMGEASPIWSR
jgi:hypothetical protein